MTVPTELAAGDTWSFTIAGGSYPAGSGWSVTLVAFNAQQRFTIDSSASGDDHELERTAAQSSAIIPGVYKWQAFAKKAGDRFRMAEGELTITPNVEGARPWDTRTDWERIRDELKAAYLAYVQGGAFRQSYTLGDISYTFNSAGEMLEKIAHAERQVEAEQLKRKLEQGIGGGRKLQVRF
jgi:hypothetical protein